MPKFAVGDKVRVRRAHSKDLIGMVGVIEEAVLVKGFYSVFIPDYPPCLVRVGQDHLTWIFTESNLELAKS
jgi:hypothetical protein